MCCRSGHYWVRQTKELRKENDLLIAACHATCLTIEYRGKSSMSAYGELLDDESNWRDGVEPYLLALYNWNRDVAEWRGGDMEDEKWNELISHLEEKNA